MIYVLIVMIPIGIIMMEITGILQINILKIMQ